MTSIDDLLAKAKAKEPETLTVAVTVAGELVNLKFTALPGEKWAGITARAPMRVDAVIDRNYGYNMHAVVKAAAAAVETEKQGDEEVVTFRYGVRVDDGEEQTLTDSQWDTLWSVLSGNEFSAVVDAIWGLNEWNPSQRVAEAKKASAPSSKRSRR